MKFLSETIKKSNLYIWVISFVISIGLLLFIFNQTNIHELANLIDLTSFKWLFLSIIVLALEGFFTGLRFKTFTPGNHSIGRCSKLSSWFIVSLVILPARLGEIAVVFLLQDYLKQSAGAAIMNTIIQRYIDLLFLASMTLIFLCLNHLFSLELLILSIVLILFFTFIGLYRIDLILGFIASTFYRHRRRPKSIVRKLFRVLLQARLYYRFHINSDIFFRGVGISFLKWLCNIGGLSLLFFSFDTQLTSIQLILSAIAYNALALIPLQTIGGIGIGEAGLMGIFLFFGLPSAFAASASILTRLVLIFIPFLFLFLVYTVSSIYEKSRKQISQSAIP